MLPVKQPGAFILNLIFVFVYFRMVKQIIHKIAVLDRWVSIKVHHWTGMPRVDSFMHLISRAADGYIYVGVAVLLFWINRELGLDFLHAAIIAFTLEMFIYIVVKRFTHRLRPFEALANIRSLIKPPDRFSFPSGHTAGAFIMATLLSAFYSIVCIPAYFLAGLVGFSRIYNGVHYTSDVLAGMVLGISCAKIGLRFIF